MIVRNNCTDESYSSLFDCSQKHDLALKVVKVAKAKSPRTKRGQKAT